MMLIVILKIPNNLMLNNGLLPEITANHDVNNVSNGHTGLMIVLKWRVTQWLINHVNNDIGSARYCRAKSLRG